IETGLVVVGPVGGGGSTRFGAAGDALNTAARLQTAAEAGTVLVGAGTQRLIADLFEWGDLRELTLKGKAETVVAYPVTAVRAEHERRSAGALEAALVGRDDELAIGNRVVDRLLSGSGGALLISGEAGIGKSRLVAELRARFEREVDPRGGSCLAGRCASYGADLPYWPFRALAPELDPVMR